MDTLILDHVLLAIASMLGRKFVAEQVVGQQLRMVQARPGHEPSLFYWQREGGRAGEIDFVLQCGARIGALDT